MVFSRRRGRSATETRRPAEARTNQRTNNSSPTLDEFEIRGTRQYGKSIYDLCLASAEGLVTTSQCGSRH